MGRDRPHRIPARFTPLDLCTSIECPSTLFIYIRSFIHSFIHRPYSFNKKVDRHNFEHKETCQHKSVQEFVKHTYMYDEIVVVHFVNFKNELVVMMPWSEVVMQIVASGIFS